MPRLSQLSPVIRYVGVAGLTRAVGNHVRATVARDVLGRRFIRKRIHDYEILIMQPFPLFRCSLILSSIVCFATNTSCAAEPSAWQAVPGADRGFAAEMPAAPKYSSVEMKTNSGSNYAMHQYLLELGDTAYVVQTAVYPDDVNVSNPRINLQGGLDNAAKNMDGGKWASVDWLTHQGSTASDAVGVRAGNAVRTFSVMKGRQIFTLTYAGPAGTARSADVNRFVGSLRVGP